MRYLEEQDEWDRAAERIAGSGAELLYVSAFSADCRVYRAGGSVFKLRRLTPASGRGRLNSLEDEYLLLQRLASTGVVAQARRYFREGEWEAIEMGPLPALRGYDPTFGEPRESVGDFAATACMTWRINRLGCSHGDLHASNAGRNVEGGLSFFDFDQAQTGHPLRCMLRDFLGLATGILAASQVSLLARLRNVRLLGVGPRIARRLWLLGVRVLAAIYRAVGRPPRPASTELAARAALRNDPALSTLARAWSLAATSDASAPGVEIAYYSLDVAGLNFPGERPWALRWDRIRRRVDFRGKRFLELGCNMGLLSIHAKMSGAAACTGVDVDARILEAAGLAAGAFGAEVTFRRQNLDAPERWEDELGAHDIVSALSVLHWVRDKERAWAFLGRFPELLYEGHESAAEAEATMRAAGFRTIVNLGGTERNRPMYWARR